MAAPTVLVVEDDKDLRESLSNLLSESYRVFTAGDGDEGLAIARDQLPSVILLDVIMPKRDGFSTVEVLRQDRATARIPILMLTAVSDLPQRLKAFRLGADDFIPKPFEPDELLARIDAKVRFADRFLRPKKTAETVCGNLVLDPRSLDVRIEGRRVHLSKLEFDILNYLVRHRNQLRSRRQILKAAWKDKKATERLLDPHMMVIRRKLEGFDHEIASIYGGGYILRARS